MWLKLTASSLGLPHCHGHCKPPPGYPQTAAVMGQGSVGGDTRTLLGSLWRGLIPCLVFPDAGLKIAHERKKM